jgi:hypothetical protein
MQTAPLDGLHDIIAPSQVSWWPLAPAWWIIIAVLLAAIVALLYYIYKQHQFKKPKRFAIALSKQLSHDDQQLHIILKRLVIEYYGKNLASQATKDWCITLSQVTGQHFEQHEINTLYSPEKSNPDLCQKLQLGIQQFKLKESFNV